MTIQDEVKYSAFPHVSHEHMQILLKCFSICCSCAKLCIIENNKKTAIICSDCADVCALAIKLHSGDSEFSQEAFDLCYAVCSRCAEECAENDSEHCIQCSKICNECAKACSQ